MSSHTPIKVGAIFGQWKLIEQIGKGGNGEVWKCKGRNSQLGAIKFLLGRHVKNEQRYKRFKAEVQAMQNCANIPGVLPLWDSHVPDPPDPKEQPWLVSVYATPMDKRLNGSESLEEIVHICASLADTLARMHERGYSHRDIKPDNIFWYGDRWCLGDFGLADFPDKGTLTADGEKLGPIHYIAPEMLNYALQADGKSTDVYSMAKLLWKLSTGQRYPLPGVQSANEPAMTISGNVQHQSAYTLDGLLESATQVDPQKRPLMKDFAKELFTWLEPTPIPTGTNDLTQYRKRILDVTQPYRQKIQRRKDLQARADSERERVFEAFNQTLSDIRNELEQAGISGAAIAGPSGGNANFYRAVTGNMSAGSGDRIWFFEFSVIAMLSDERHQVRLKIGVNLGVKNVEDDPTTLHDIYAPVLASVGLLLEIRVKDGKSWNESTQLIWGESGSFFFGQPSEIAVTKRFLAGLQSNLVQAVKALVNNYENVGGQ